MSQDQQHVEAGAVRAQFGPVHGVPVEAGALGQSLLAQSPADADRSDAGADPSALVNDP